MLVTSLIWLYILFLAYVYGGWGIKLASQLTRSDPTQPFPFSLTLVTGLCIINLLAGIISLFTKLGALANILLILGAGFILWFNRKDLASSLGGSLGRLRKTHPLIWILFIALLLLALVRTIDFPLNYDTGLYHAQAIRWIESFPAVPGLGILHFRLAFNSSWLLSSALLSFSFIGSGSFHVLGGLFYLMIIAYGLSKFARLLEGEVNHANLIGLFVVFLSRYLYALELSSPGTDLPAAMLVWLVFLLSLEKIECGEHNRLDVRSVLILLLSTSAVTIKLSVLPIMFLPLYFGLFEIRLARRNTLLMYGSTLLILILPWIARSVIQSGYLVFPLAQTELSFLDWRIPPGDVQNVAQAITSWARLPGLDPTLVLHMPYSEWVPAWFQALQAFDRRLLYAVVTGLTILVGYGIFTLLRVDGKHRQLGSFIILYLTALAGIAYWFIQSPAVRFGYGFLGILLCLCVAPALKVILEHTTFIRRIVVYTLLAGMLLYQGVGIYHLRNVAVFQDRMIYPATYPVIEVKQLGLGNFSSFSPSSGDQCWYAELPCTPINNPWVNLRGPLLSDGFYDKRNNIK